MKNILLTVIILGVTLLASCEGKYEPPPSLEGTRWGADYYVGEHHYVEEMVFTSSTATYIGREDGEIFDTFSGRYVYDPVESTFVMPNDSPQPYPPNDEIGTIPDLKGTIKDDVMTFEIAQSFDVFRIVSLKKRPYSPLFVGLTDNYNQGTNSANRPNDNIQGVPPSVVWSIITTSNNWTQCRAKLLSYAGTGTGKYYTTAQFEEWIEAFDDWVPAHYNY